MTPHAVTLGLDDMIAMTCDDVVMRDAPPDLSIEEVASLASEINASLCEVHNAVAVLLYLHVTHPDISWITNDLRAAVDSTRAQMDRFIELAASCPEIAKLMQFARFALDGTMGVIEGGVHA